MTERIVTDANALRRLHAELESIKQAITDPENQPSQFGTVTVEYMNREIEAEREEIASEFEKLHENVKHLNNYWLHAAKYVRARGSA